jgi:hypothetical protein
MIYLNDFMPVIGPNSVDMYEFASLYNFNNALKEGNIQKPEFRKLFNPINYALGNPVDIIIANFTNVDIGMDGKNGFQARDLTDKLYVFAPSWIYKRDGESSFDLLEDCRLSELQIRYSLGREKAMLNFFKRFGPQIKEKDKSFVGLENCVTSN